MRAPFAIGMRRGPRGPRRALFAIGLLGLAVAADGCSRGSPDAAQPASGEAAGGSPERTLLHVSYDPTRELYEEVNRAFTAAWKQRTGQLVRIQQSHGGSGKQARAVIDGLQADVVSLALAHDIDAIAARARLLPADWRTRLPHGSAPLSSTVVFVVRKGNPKHIRDWDDLVRPGISVITPNPKTSGGARWNYLAAWGAAQRRAGGDASRGRAFVEALFRNVPVLDSGARGATTTFARRKLGDVLIAWESEALLLTEEIAKGELELVAPSESILAEPPVALLDVNVDRHGNRDLAQAYLEFLYSEAAQQLGAKHFYRPTSPAIAREHRARFCEVKLFGMEEVFGGWAKAHQEHFANGGTFDAIYLGGR